MTWRLHLLPGSYGSCLGLVSGKTSQKQDIRHLSSLGARMASSHHDLALTRRLSQVNHILLVLSGKGGVGKSSVAAQLALALLHQRPGSRIGILDIDLTGPSVPRMLGLQGRSVHQSTDGWVPVQTDFNWNQNDDSQSNKPTSGTLKCMSIGFLLKDPKDSVVWRGPKKNAMIRQFLTDVRWGELDWLIVDTPPGTSDEHISLLEQLSFLFSSQSSALKLPTLSSVLVTTPQAVSLSDVSKEFDFTKKTGLKVIGLIENMSGYICPHCGQTQNVFGSGGGLAFCEKISAEAGQPSEQLEFLGAVPLDVEFMKLMDQAMEPNTNGSAETASQDMVQKYAQTPLISQVFAFSNFIIPICLKKDCIESIILHSSRGVTSLSNQVGNEENASSQFKCSLPCLKM
ncbi:hypothetical protein O181_021756 [Austropuccinia psidii MF-1]|uniref:Cytosolic Fe-S cluster assembly factor CFD1 n=1 Tax=Austropuccinia psidii MF-1 TaxID=1389203 RepID=A0A9Q3CBK6_9BASI|nr:hypothetical protein [Austropuccinia psidii MF-1]